MVVREKERSDHPGITTQVGVLEDNILVEHFVTSDSQASMAVSYTHLRAHET